MKATRRKYYESWTDAKEVRLREMIAGKSHSYGQMAATLNVSKGMLQGKIELLGLTYEWKASTENRIASDRMVERAKIALIHRTGKFVKYEDCPIASKPERKTYMGVWA